MGWTGYTSGLIYLTRDYTKTITATCMCCEFGTFSCHRPDINCTYTLHEECDPETGDVTSTETGRSCHAVGCVSGDGDCSAQNFFFDILSPPSLCSGFGSSCSATADSDSHASCFEGYMHDWDCAVNDVPFTCNCFLGGSDFTVSEETTLSNPCIP
jgi:hypothetical protein